MNRLIDFPHLVAVILVYYSSTKDDYINVVLRVLRPCTELKHDGRDYHRARIREIYEMYSYKFRKWYALTPHKLDTHRTESLIRDDIKKIFIEVKTSNIIQAVENADRISSLHMSCMIADNHVFMCPKREIAFKTKHPINSAMHKNVSLLGVYKSAGWDIGFENVKNLKDTMHICITHMDGYKKVSIGDPVAVSMIADSVEHLSVSESQLYWEGMTRYSTPCSGPYKKGTPIMRLEYDVFVRDPQYHKNILYACFATGDLFITVERLRADGSFVPRHNPPIGNLNYIDFSNVESKSITSITITKRSWDARDAAIAAKVMFGENSNEHIAAEVITMNILILAFRDLGAYINMD